MSGGNSKPIVKSTPPPKNPKPRPPPPPPSPTAPTPNNVKKKNEMQHYTEQF